MTPSRRNVEGPSLLPDPTPWGWKRQGFLALPALAAYGDLWRPVPPFQKRAVPLLLGFSTRARPGRAPLRGARLDRCEDAAGMRSPVCRPGGDMKAKPIGTTLRWPSRPEGGRFVEVEEESGQSINVGTWVEAPGGMWELRIDVPVEGQPQGGQ